MRAFPLFCWILVTSSLDADDFFATKVQPVLRERCFQCHSHGEKIKGGLVLDSKSGWEKGGDSGPALVPGNPGKSLLVRAVRWQDKDFRMPPKEKLPDGEVAILEEWVMRGAPDPRVLDGERPDPLDWWSLKPLLKLKAPGEGNPVDAFVRAKLEEKGLQPSPRADRRTLARRLYFDLHGILPTPEEAAAFDNDPAPDAWPKLVDKLLSSPRYGERWARHWLDVIHFADSHGCEHDIKRPNAWRFRDYVVGRLNEDVPWARFIREQLAPDFFFPEEPRLTAGLGFIAAGPFEQSRAATAPVTFAYLDRDDMVTQTMAAFASTTANCARCHEHKFDPVSQEDYYSLQAVFAGIGKGDIEYDASSEVAARRKELRQVLYKDPKTLLNPEYATIVRDWETKQDKSPAAWSILAPEVFLSEGGATLTRQEDGSIFASGKMEATEAYVVTSSVPLEKLTAIRVEALQDDRLPKGGPGRANNGNFHLSDAKLKWFPKGGETGIDLKIAKASADFDQEAWTSSQAIDNDLKSGWAIYPKVNQSHFIVFELAETADISAGGKLVVTLNTTFPPEHYMGRFRLSATDAGGGLVGVLPAEVVEALKNSPESRSEAEKVAIAGIALESWAKAELQKLPAPEVVYGVSANWVGTKEHAEAQPPKTVHLLRRGDIHQPLREVGPGALLAIPRLEGRFQLPNPKEEASRRSALADWLAHPDNPLTWRSIVNRVWHYHFGRGLCDTPNDFGRMGSMPTHPELLDWLAVWFRDEAKGSLKELHRLILTSETWQQSSIPGDALQDASNPYLSHANRRRLDAESFRDSALQISGRIDWEMGGPGIEQFKKSPGPQETPSLDYQAYDWNSPGANRRSIYRVVWRGIPDPFMDALDFPDMGLLTPKRTFSVSALQSLSLYNNNFVLTASGWIAGRLEKEPDPIAQAVQLFWQREPGDAELASFQEYARQHGLAALCRILLNSNEFHFVD